MKDSKILKVSWRAGRVAAKLIPGILCFCLFTGGMARPSPPPSPNLILEKRRVALVIGNAVYAGQPTLRNPVHDAIDMKAALEKLHFEVTLGMNLDRTQMQAQIDRFIREVQRGDVALFYYAGHGMQINGENLLAPVDFPMTPPEDRMGDVSVRFDQVQSSLERSPASLSILIMDACRNNPFRSNRSLRVGFAPVSAGLGSYVAFAASPGQTADDGDKNGLFTTFLLQSLKEPLPLSQLFRGVRDAVYDASQDNPKQKPYLSDQIIGDFLFRPPARPEREAPPSAQTAQSQELLEEGLRLYRQGQCGPALAQFDRAVRQDPENAFAQNALGMAYVCQKQYALAIPAFGLAIRSDYNLAAAYRNRGSAYNSVGKYEYAVKDFTWAIEQDGADAVSYAQRGASRFLLGMYKEAIADYTSAIQFNSSAAGPYYGRGQVYQRQGHYQEAFDDYTAALERNKNFAEARKELDSVRQRLPGRRQ